MNPLIRASMNQDLTILLHKTRLCRERMVHFLKPLSRASLNKDLAILLRKTGLWKERMVNFVTA